MIEVNTVNTFNPEKEGTRIYHYSNLFLQSPFFFFKQTQCPLWGLNSQPQDQECLIAPLLPLIFVTPNTPCIRHSFVTNTSCTVCYTLLYMENTVLYKQFMNHISKQFPVTWEMLTKRQLPDNKC